MSFQAAVATWCAAHIVSSMPIGGRFGLAGDLNAIAIQCETGIGMDDVVLTLPHGVISIQCKTQLSLEKATTSAIAKTIAQLVKFHAYLTQSGQNYASCVAVLAVGQSAPKSLFELEEGLRAFDLGESWARVLGRLADKPKQALQLFEAHVRSAWQDVYKGNPNEQDLADLARLFRIRRFGDDETSPDWREASQLLGRRLYGGEENGAAPLGALSKVSRKLISSGALADRNGLLRQLRDAGHKEVSAPVFDADIQSVQKYSDSEQLRLKRHAELPIGGGLALKRDCLPALLDCIGQDTLLVTGEPGAGKTGVLLALANSFRERGTPVVFLSAERLAGFTTTDDFRRQLALEHSLFDVLANWPAGTPGIVIVDALDVSRGGPSEEILASFIEEIVFKLHGQWSVVASIRSFDLRNGRRFRLLARGNVPNVMYAENGLESVRHFRVPALSAIEIESAGQQSPQLLALYEVAPPALRALLGNLFNLSIASDLLRTGTPAESIRGLSTQFELVKAYEDDRMPTQPARRAARAVVETMIAQQKLAVRNVDIQSDELETLLLSGVANATGDLVSFAHHVLFDHIAGRFYLDPNNIDTLSQQLSSAPLAGLLLGPALRFSLEMVWSNDTPSRDTSWRFLLTLAAEEVPDPVIVSVGIRTAVEKVAEPTDVAALALRVEEQPGTAGLAGLISQIARFVNLATENVKPTPGVALAWSQLAHAAAESGDVQLLDGARILLWSITGTADLSQADVLASCGASARALLLAAWSSDRQSSALTTMAIRMVTKTFGADSQASRRLLERILTPERLEKHASEEALWLAEGVQSIIRHDPSFAASIFKVMFTYKPSSEEKTWIGGAPSRILALSSTVQQDYEHARWQLRQALPDFLKTAPEQAVVAVAQSLTGLAGSGYRRPREPKPVVVTAGEGTVTVLDDAYGWDDWRAKDLRPGDSEDDILTSFTEFLRTCPDEAFAQTVAVLSGTEASASLWARVLGIAAESRLGVVDDRLWSLASEPQFSALHGLIRDAVIFLIAIYDKRSLAERTAFEQKALGAYSEEKEADTDFLKRSMLERFLSDMPEEQLVTPEMVALRRELAAADELTGNRPWITTSVGWRDDSPDVVDTMLRSEGVDLHDEVVKSIREACRTLEALTRPVQDQPAILADMWRHVGTLRRMLEQPHEPPLAEAILHSSWGVVSNALEVIAQGKTYVPGADGLPMLDELRILLVQLGHSSYPIARETDAEDESLSWGNWDIRVYVASSTAALAMRFGDQQPALIEEMAYFLDDPVPTVRLQAVERLNALWGIARPRMWELCHKVSQSENNVAVLTFFVGGPLSRIANGETERALSLLAQILERIGRAPKESGRDQFCEAVGSMVGNAYVFRGSTSAWQWLQRWSRDLVEGQRYLQPILHTLRDIFFLRYRAAPTQDQLQLQERAMHLLQMLVDSAGKSITEATLRFNEQEPASPGNLQWKRLYAAGDQVIDQAVNQLYFGSGAYQAKQPDSDNPGVSTPSAKLAFLRDYSAILDAISDVGSPRALHYLLETLEYLVDGAPQLVFERVHRIVLGQGARQGYQFESLALDEVVKIVELYLADHRRLFDVPEQRQRLIEMIQLFAEVGWSKAFKLLYDLPELLR